MRIGDLPRTHLASLGESGCKYQLARESFAVPLSARSFWGPRRPHKHKDPGLRQEGLQGTMACRIVMIIQYYIVQYYTILCYTIPCYNILYYKMSLYGI